MRASKSGESLGQPFRSGVVMRGDGSQRDKETEKEKDYEVSRRSERFPVDSFADDEKT